ncbi:rhamnulokinase [Pelagicoccus albus]|uniref:Rhamnulokinase n=1 Tax=Pelagicoccus albus TaxID=415222 RepID=A0A7X1B3Z0_9BACT|nr:rhamnulokinase family protein [Pelagicoccus albus]MBC2605213.1 rhamnulokinase [Pelagicoccus albus]
MSLNQVYLAVDLGAGSGRVIAGEFDGERIELRELNRFDNTPVELPSGWHWNITDLYRNIVDGLKKAGELYSDRPISVGVDTWGVDYGLLDEQGNLLGLPYQYRDKRTDGMMDLADQIIGKQEIYRATGIQLMFFNTIFQLLSEVERKNPALDIAADLLFLPDLISYWLSGVRSQERSVVSTSQLYNPIIRDWDRDLIERLGMPEKLFKKISDPGEELGPLLENVAQKTGLTKTKVVTIAGHDTASAVAAIPSQEENPAFLSSGTWSLMGLDLPRPNISDESFIDAFTNEIGVGHGVRFLKNICGLWLIQESRRHWLANGEDIPYSRMADLASEAEPFRSLIYPDDPLFEEAGRMPEKVQAYCRHTGQPIPETPGQIIRCIYESLALRYSEVWQRLISYVVKEPTSLHIVGGGCQDNLLNQFAANAIGITVKAGPVEATGLGNIITQMLASGAIGSLKEGRQVVANSAQVKTFEPQDPESWKAAYQKYKAVLASRKSKNSS